MGVVIAKYKCYFFTLFSPISLLLETPAYLYYTHFSQYNYLTNLFS